MSIEIDVQDLACQLNTGKILLVDVREQSEFNSEHIEGSIHVPLGTLENTNLNLDGYSTIVCICRSGRRSLIAREMIIKRDNPPPTINILSLQGGVQEWMKQGLPVV